VLHFYGVIKVRSTFLVTVRGRGGLYRGAERPRSAGTVREAQDGRWELLSLYGAGTRHSVLSTSADPRGQIEAVANDSMVSAELRIPSDSTASLEEDSATNAAQQAAELDMMNELSRD